ncbi:hypothetical protein SEF58_09270 [Neomoorella humiferrea]|uniref:hypothetical protein n=1 Tax=Neomoorella humiferrea TaxID=676965 RepID=UPI003D8D2401
MLNYDVFAFFSSVGVAIIAIAILEFAAISIQIILLATGLLVFCGVSAYMRYQRFGIVDPVFLFAIFFTLYNGTLLLQVGLELYLGFPS